MRSFWLNQALEAEPGAEAPPLDGDLRCDVCIVGGGYTGLWTALELNEREPSLDIVLIEVDICGAGGSGANVGFALTAWGQFLLLEKMCGTEGAMRICETSVADIARIGKLAQAHGADIGYRADGVIWGATCEAQSGHWDCIINALEKHQVHAFTHLTRAEIAARTGTTAHVAGVLDAEAVHIQPARLVRLLRRVALERGVRIYENTPMRRLVRARPPGVVTPRGTITAGKVILGIYAWSLLVPELRGAIMVIGTDAVATEAMPEKVAEAGWAGGPGLTDSRVFVSGSRATAEGRVIWSKAGGVLPYGDRMAGRFGGPHHPLAQLRDVIRQTYPGLADAPIAGTWAGPIERSKTGLPLFGALPICPDILYGYGYSGSGVVASLLGARILASLALEHGDEWADLGLVRSPTRGFPPEPIRYIGGHMVRAAIERQDRLDHEGRRPGPITRALVAFKPSSYKPA